MNDLPLLQYPITLKGAMLEECDLPRLNTVARRVWDIMVQGGYHELNDIAHRLGVPHSTVTACVRAFRYLENGGHTVNTIRNEEDKGTWLYQLEPATPDEVKANKARAKAQKRRSKSAFTDGQRYALTQLSKMLNQEVLTKPISYPDFSKPPEYVFSVSKLQNIINQLMPGEEHE